jgi:hypothetical protein
VQAWFPANGHSIFIELERSRKKAIVAGDGTAKFTSFRRLVDCQQRSDFA